MKKNKNSKGMTLVEVVIAMTIFAMVSGCVLSAVAGAVQQTARNRKRDLETGQQVNAVRKNSDDKVTEVGGYTLTFDDGRTDGSNKVKTKMYEANDAQFGSDFGFQLKSFSNTAPGSVATANNGDGEYLITIDNTSSSEDLTVYVTVSAGRGYIYEGASHNDGYIHTSQSYIRTVKANSSVNFGYYSNDTSHSIKNGDLSIYFISESNATLGTYSPRTYATSGKDITYTANGGVVNQAFSKPAGSK